MCCASSTSSAIAALLVFPDQGVMQAVMVSAMFSVVPSSLYSWQNVCSNREMIDWDGSDGSA